MRTFNSDFLWCALLLLSLILLHISRRKAKVVNLNNRIFHDIVVLGLLDVVFDLVSNAFITRCADSFCIGAELTTNVFFLFQALLPFSLLCYIRVLIENRRLSARELLVMALPTLSLTFIILTNPFTDALFYFDARGYRHGPLYYAMYVSAALHLLTALILTVVYRRLLGKDRTLALIETFFLAVSGVVFQALHPQILTTGFGMSLSILAMFTTINNPQANTDSLTGLYDKQFLLRRVDEMLAQEKPFHVLTVYLYSLVSVNRTYGMQGGDAMLQHIAKQLQSVCGTPVFRLTGKRFLILAESLKEYDEDLSGVRALFEGRGTDAPGVFPVILCGVPHAERIGSSGDVMAYVEYLDGLPAPNGSTCVVQANANTMRSFLYNRQVEQFLSRAVDAFSQADIGLCLDDFGLGFANLNSVTHLPFSAIKLDRSLLYHICTDARAALFYQSIVSTFQRMGYNVIAEGVETEKEVELLKMERRSDSGLLFLPPAPRADAARSAQ